jgi:AraC-like DNA-binding protein
MSALNLISSLGLGFSVVSALLLYATYLIFLKNLNKTWLAVLSCGLLLIALSRLQILHLDFFINQTDLFLNREYLFWLFLTPPMFYLFSRAILLPAAANSPLLLLHLTPLAFNFIPRYEIALTLIFLVGTGYSLWFANLIYQLRAQRRRFRLEMFFFAIFAVMAVLILVLGALIHYLDHRVFYLGYANCISLAFVLIVLVLLSFPDLLNELAAVAQLSYATSTLKGVPIAQVLQQLEDLMRHHKLFQNENLNLSMVATALKISTHQLSELINVHFGMGFSRYIREQRVREAKALLRQDQTASILSISMETGFKSQSNFYAAFKEITGQAPGDYRKSLAATAAATPRDS